MNVRAAAAVAIPVAVALAPLVARADIPPPPTDPSCTVERQASLGGGECLVPDGEGQRWKERGFERRCGIYLRWSSSGPAVWCRKAPARSGAAPAASQASAEPDRAAACKEAARAAPPPAGDVAAFVAASNAFALTAWRHLREGDNTALSPLALWSALAATAAGASGDTAAQLRAVLGTAERPEALARAAQALALRLECAGEGRLALPRRLFSDRAYPPEREAAARLAAAGAPLEPLDLAHYPGDARGRIDAWIAAASGGRLSGLVPPLGVYENTRLVLASAGSLLARLPASLRVEPAPLLFYPRRTRVGRILAGFDVKEVPALRATGTFRFAAIPDVPPDRNDRGAPIGARVLDVPLEDGLAMTLVLPDRVDGIHDLPVLPLQRWLEPLRSRDVVVTLPRFSLDPGPRSAGDALARAGIVAAFDRKQADLSGLHRRGLLGERLFVGEVFHRARVEVESGAAPGAPRAIPARAEDGARRDEPEEFRADHPFLLFVREATTGAILFMGMVNDPAPAARAWSVGIDPDTQGPVGRGLPPGAGPRADGPMPLPASPQPPSPAIRAVSGEVGGLTIPPAASGYGLVTITAKPWASVFQGGRELGETPREIVIRAGRHRFRAEHPALGSVETTLEVRAGKRVTWDAPLVPPRP